MVSAFEMFTAGDALEYKLLKSAPDAVELKVTRCRYAEFYKKTGAPELGFLLTCGGDTDFFHASRFRSQRATHRNANHHARRPVTVTFDGR